MKLSHLLLAASLAANAALIAVFVAGVVTADGSTTRTREIDPALTLSAPRHPAPVDPSSIAPGPDTWPFLSAGDLPTQLARLRAQGFSPSLTRSILAAHIRTTLAPRRKELEMLFQRSPFYRPKMLDAEAFAELRTLTHQEDRAIHELLGPDLDSAAAQSVRHSLPGAPDEKIAQVADILANYDQLRQDFTSVARGPLQPDEREQLNALDKAMRTELSAALTPPELEDYDVRTSNIASQLRTTLATVEVTEAEFRALFKLQNDASNQFAPLSGAITQEQLRARSDAQRQLQGQIAAVLGPDRFATYQQANDYSYRQTAQLVTRLELPAETANQVYLVQQDLQQRAVALQTNRALAPEDRNAQLATLAAEAQTKVTSVLGPRGYEAYKQYGGSWLQQLQPRR